MITSALVKSHGRRAVRRSVMVDLWYGNGLDPRGEGASLKYCKSYQFHHILACKISAIIG